MNNSSISSQNTVNLLKKAFIPHYESKSLFQCSLCNCSLTFEVSYIYMKVHNSLQSEISKRLSGPKGRQKKERLPTQCKEREIRASTVYTNPNENSILL